MTTSIKSSIFFVGSLMNFIFATGVFTLPFSMYESGIILATIVMVISCCLSIIASTFILECLAIHNCFLKEEKRVLEKAISIQNQSLVNEKNPEKMKSIENYPNLIKQSENPEDSEILLDEEDDDYFIFKRAEISKMANKVLNKPLYFFILITMICYIYIGITSNAMITGKSLKSILSLSLGYNLSDDYYYIIVGAFFGVVVLLALNNINNLKRISIFIIFCRFTILFLIFGSSIYSIVENGITDFEEIPKFNISNITVIFGNALFLFMSHHSIPGLVENFKPQRNLIKLVIIAYIISFFLMLTHGYLALFAFSKYKNCDFNEFPCALQSMYSLNFLSFSVIGYIINYYPVFNVITSALLTITMKNNILQAIGNCSKPLYIKLNFAEKSGFTSILLGLLSNIILTLPAVAAAILLPDIQQLMKYFSSVFGFAVMVIIPLILINTFRKKLRSSNNFEGRFNKSFIRKNWQLVILCILGAAIFGLIIYGFTNPLNKTCVAE